MGRRGDQEGGDVFAVGEFVAQVDHDAPTGHLGALAEGDDHALLDPSWGYIAVALLERPLGEHDLRERGSADLDDLGTATLVRAHTRLVADTELLPFPGADQIQQVGLVATGPGECAILAQART